MKIRIELDENLIEDEVLIHCRSLDENVRKIQEAVSQVLTGKQQLICYPIKFIFFLIRLIGCSVDAESTI